MSVAAAVLGLAVAAPGSASGFVPASGDWEGAASGQPISWQVVRSGRKLVVRDFVNGAPACTPAGQPARYGLNMFPSFGSVSGGIFGTPPVSLLGQHPRGHDYGYGGRFLSRRRAVFGAIGPARRSAGCSVPAVHEIFRVRPARRRPVGDGSWSGPVDAGGGAGPGGEFQLAVTLGGRIIQSFSGSAPADCGGMGSGGVSFSHGGVFVSAGGSFHDSLAIPGGRVVVTGTFESRDTVHGTFTAPGPGGPCPGHLTATWSARLR